MVFGFHTHTHTQIWQSHKLQLFFELHRSTFASTCRIASDQRCTHTFQFKALESTFSLAATITKWQPLSNLHRQFSETNLIRTESLHDCCAEFWSVVAIVCFIVETDFFPSGVSVLRLVWNRALPPAEISLSKLAKELLDYINSLPY